MMEGVYMKIEIIYEKDAGEWNWTVLQYDDVINEWLTKDLGTEASYEEASDAAKKSLDRL